MKRLQKALKPPLRRNPRVVGTEMAAPASNALTAPPDPNTIRVAQQVGKSDALQLAEAILSPSVTNAVVAQKFAARGGEGTLGITETMLVLDTACAAVRANDMSGMEAVLTTQALSLNVMFTELARRAALNMGQYPEATESYIRMAMKAQSQCRATIETLGALKNPPAVFAKHANIAQNQQINHAPVEKQISPNEKMAD